MLQDVHIIRFYGTRTVGDKQYLFLEYASGGELFDKIGKVMSGPDWANLALHACMDIMYHIVTLLATLHLTKHNSR